MPSNTYDLVVLGDDLAALVCGTLCARRGMRTLVLGSDRPARYMLGPHKLPVEPMLWPVTPGSAGERVLKELHAEMAMRRKLREPRIAAQLVTSDFRLDLGGERIATELARELDSDGDALLASWERSHEVARLLDPLLSGEHAFPGVGFFEKREVAKLVEHVRGASESWWETCASHPRAKLLASLAAIALRHPAPPPGATARATSAWYAGPPALRGDGDAVRDLLVEKLTTAGGELRAGTITEANVSWGKLSSFTLQSGEDIGAGQVVSSKTPMELVELLGKKAPKKLHELAESMQLVGYRYTLNIVLDEAGIPEHMAPTVAVIADPDAEPVGDAVFSIHLGEADDGGRVIATIAATLPADEPLYPIGHGEAGGPHASVERAAPKCAALRAALWQRIGDVMPFFEKHLVLAHSPFEPNPPHVPGGRGSYEVPRNLPLPMAPVWRDNPQASYVTGLKNLTLTGDQILPGYGIEGALAAGWSAAKIACALAGKKKDYLRDEVVGAAS